MTGRGNYQGVGEKVGLDLAGNPGLVIEPANALPCGVADFVRCGCLPFAKADDVKNVTKRLNGGFTGLAERTAWLARWKTALAGLDTASHGTT